RGRLSVHQPLSRRCGAAAAMTHGLELVDELRMREKLGHRPEGKPPEVLVEAGDHHTHSAGREFERGHDDALTEELSLVDTDDVGTMRLRCDITHRRERHPV